MGFSFINHPFWGTTISGNPPNLRYSVIELKPHNWAVSFHLANHLGHRKIPWPQARPALRAGVGNRWWRVPEFLSLEVEEFRSPSAKSLRKPPPISPGSALPMIWGEKKAGSQNQSWWCLAKPMDWRTKITERYIRWYLVRCSDVSTAVCEPSHLSFAF